MENAFSSWFKYSLPAIKYLGTSFKPKKASKSARLAMDMYDVHSIIFRRIVLVFPAKPLPFPPFSVCVYI